MYIQGMAVQTQLFILCIGFGFFLGIIYGILTGVREILFKSDLSVFVQDIIISIIFTVLVFLFLLCVCSGEIRFYTLLALVLGFIIYYFTFGYLISVLLSKISIGIIKLKIKTKKSTKNQ